MRDSVVLVLRGRPGLGHVMPGLALAHAFRARGLRAHVVTYDNGARFLASSRYEDCTALDVGADYYDWPGLLPYDHGLRHLVPLVRSLEARLVLFGGEYLLGPLTPDLGCTTVMMLNPEILERSPRNEVAANLFSQSFAACTYLLPLFDNVPAAMLPQFEPLRGRLLAGGPFRVNHEPLPPQPDRALRIVVANGGGVSFPRRTDSYSDEAVDPEHWLRQTEEMTRLAARAAAQAPDAVVHVFSCLSPEWNHALADELGGAGNVTVHAPSLQFYDELRRADVVVSRAGAGLASEVLNSRAQLVLWPLVQHTEQLANALELQRRRPGVLVAQDSAALQRELARAVAAARTSPLPAPDESFALPVARAVDFLTERLQRAN